MSVGLVVDGGASLPDAPTPVPITLVEMAITGAAASAGGGPSTAAPAPGAFLEAIQRAERGSGVVVITVARRLSASYEAARAAAEVAGGSSRVLVVDSGSATTGEGLVALAAANAAAADADLDAVAAAATRAAESVRLVAQIPTLDRLAHGGRLPPGVLGAARWTGARPLFMLRNGRLLPLRPAFSAAAAEARILAAFRRTRPGSGRLHVAALYAGERAVAERLLSAATQCEPATLFAAPLSALMLTHTGPGVSGLSWWWEPV